MRRHIAVTVAIVATLGYLRSATLARAQSPKPVAQSRISRPIDDDLRVVLKGSTNPRAQDRFDRGAAPDDLQLDHMRLVLKRTAKQQAELDALLEAQQTSGSAEYHRWLTPTEFGERFGPSLDDIAKVAAWLEAHGFHIDEVPAGRTAIDFSGTAAEVREAFHTSIDKFVVRGRAHWANTQEPEIPAAFADVVAGVANLDSFFSQPQVVRSFRPHRLNVDRSPKPDDSEGWYGSQMGPSDFAVIYNLSPLYQSGISGSGATIAVVGRSDINVQDVADFRRVFGLPVNPPQVVVNGTDPGDLGGGEELEAVLDNSWAGAVAENATVMFVVSASTNTADGTLLSEEYVINNNLADVMTESFSLCEADASQSYANYLSSLAQQAAGEGISFFVSSGDSGASGCDYGSETSATGPLSVNVLGSSPFITMVGGTQFNETVGNGPYWSESNLSAYYLSALSYIPEKVWNFSCSVAQCGSNEANLWSAGGGASQYFTKPSWQSGFTGVPNDGARDVPDVSMAASGEHDPYLLCVDGGCGESMTTPNFSYVGGTSAATPAFAGITALVRQKTGARQGQANPVLYQLAAAEQLSNCNSYGPPGSTCVFNDVTAGNNSVPGGQGFGTGSASYQAGVGYDLASGLGSVNASNLVNRWSSVTTAPVVQLQPGSIAFGNQAVGTTSSAHQVTLTNTGNAALSITSIALTGLNPYQFAQTSTCGSSLSAGANCTISVTFAPTTAFSPSASLTVTDNASGSPQSVSLTGTGTGPRVSLSPTTSAFGNQAVGTTSSAHQVTLTNIGNTTLSITSIALTGLNPYQFAQTNACPATLSAGANCTISVTFAPTTAFSPSASLTVTDSAPGSPHSVTLTGTGTGPRVSLSPSSIAFGNQAVGTTSSAHQVTLTNIGNTTLSLTSIALTGLNPYQFAQANTCGASLTAGANCTISVTFSPTTAFSPSASLTVTDNASGSPHSVTLTGTGTGPRVSLSPTSIAFGNQTVGTTSSVHQLTLTNIGNTMLNITSIALTGPNPHQFAQTNTCGASLSAGANCTISVTFSPTTAFSPSASLTVTDNASGSPHSVTLTGTGTGPRVSLNPASIAFGNQAVGTTSSIHQVTFTNIGNTTLSITSIALTGPNPYQFAQTNTCGASLNAGANCTFSVTFAPTVAFSPAALLSVTDNAAGSPHSVSLTATGVSP